MRRAARHDLWAFVWMLFLNLDHHSFLIKIPKSPLQIALIQQALGLPTA